MAERIQKVLARAGFGSRRQVESWIEAGQITVNGEKAELGAQITEADRVKLDGKALSPKRLWKKTAEVLLYHKPVGEVCTRQDPEGRRTIYQSLPKPEQGRWVSVGRLDLNTSGLLILTTDGELANQLMHPSNEMDREYAVRVLGEVTPEMMQNLRDGVQLEDGEAHFADIQPAGGDGANQWFHVVIQEGRNREVRRLWESQGVQVSRLMRVRFGPVIMPSRLRPGRWMLLEAGDMDNLYREAGLAPASPATGKKAPARRPAPKAPAETAQPDTDRGTRAKRPARRSGNENGKTAKPQSRWPQKPARGPRIRGRGKS